MQRGRRMLRAAGYMNFLTFLCFFLFLQGAGTPCWARMQAYTHTIRQIFAGSQSPDDARTAAIARAKREVLEQAGTYLETLTVVRDNQVVRDDILALASGILSARIVAEENFVESGSFGIAVTAEVMVDTSGVEARITRLLEDRSRLAEYRAIQDENVKLLQRISQLERKNRELTKTGSSEARNRIKNDFESMSQSLAAMELMNKAADLFEGGRFRDPAKALQYLDAAILMEPDYARAHLNRGTALMGLKQYDKALKAVDHALALTPDLAIGYNNRGLLKAMTGQRSEALSDFDKALELDPGLFEGRINRCRYYAGTGQYSKALADCNEAVRISPDDGAGYAVRGRVYSLGLGDHEAAMSDFATALDIAQRGEGQNKRLYVLADLYHWRGEEYDRIGYADSAVRDFSSALGICSELREKSLVMNSAKAKIYVDRAEAYFKLGKQNKGCEDLLQACALGACSGLEAARKEVGDGHVCP